MVHVGHHDYASLRGIAWYNHYLVYWCRKRLRALGADNCRVDRMQNICGIAESKLERNERHVHGP